MTTARDGVDCAGRTRFPAAPDPGRVPRASGVDRAGSAAASGAPEAGND